MAIGEIMSLREANYYLMNIINHKVKYWDGEAKDATLKEIKIGGDKVEYTVINNSGKVIVTDKIFLYHPETFEVKDPNLQEILFGLDNL